MGANPCSQVPKSCGKPSRTLMPIVLDWNVQHTLDHLLYVGASCLVKPLAPLKKKENVSGGWFFFLHTIDSLLPWDMREFHHVPLKGFREHSWHFHRCQAGFVMHGTERETSTFLNYTRAYAYDTALLFKRLPAGDYSHKKNFHPTFVCM